MLCSLTMTTNFTFGEETVQSRKSLLPILTLTDSTFASGSSLYKITNENTVVRERGLQYTCSTSNSCYAFPLGIYSSDTMLVENNNKLALASVKDGRVHDLTNNSTLPSWSPETVMLTNRKVAYCVGGVGSDVVGCFIAEVENGNAVHGKRFDICDGIERCFFSTVWAVDSSRLVIVYSLGKKVFIKLGLIEDKSINFLNPLLLVENDRYVFNIGLGVLSAGNSIVTYNMGAGRDPSFIKHVSIGDDNSISISEPFKYNESGPEIGHSVIPLTETKFLLQYYGGVPFFDWNFGRAYYLDGFFRLGSIDSQEEVDSIVLGLKDEKGSSLFTLYPNPTNSQFCIEQPIAKNYKLQINNLSGQTVLSLDLNLETECIDLGSLPTGVYLVNLSNAHSSVTERIIIK